MNLEALIYLTNSLKNLESEKGEARTSGCLLPAMFHQHFLKDKQNNPKNGPD